MFFFLFYMLVGEVIVYYIEGVKKFFDEVDFVKSVRIGYFFVKDRL